MTSQDKRPKCPLCGAPLELTVTAQGFWSKKIKKDGNLYKNTNYCIGSPTGNMFFSCPKYQCNFHYDVSSTPAKVYPLLEEWLDEHYEEIKF